MKGTFQARVFIGDDYRQEEVEADIIGPFAIHKTLYKAPTCELKWSISHIKTGYRIISTITKAKAKAAIKILKESGLNWEISDIEAMYDREKVLAAKQKMIDLGIL